MEEKSLEQQEKELKERQLKIQQEKANQFQIEYKELCQKYGMELSPIITISSQGIVSNLEIKYV